MKDVPIFTPDEINNSQNNSKQKDSSSKIIFGNAQLCAQFLRGYTEIPLLKNVQPEDIEDVSERYVRMFQEERNSDVVKRVRIKDSETPFFLVSLIEHKSSVDYNVVMQILRYMICIWEEYEKEMERIHPRVAKTKSFRYPPIIPIVFYDGSNRWTAPLNLKDRIYLSETLQEYIPDYKCLLINPRDYSDMQLMEKKDILSFIMMLDKIQEAGDFRNITEKVPPDYLKEVASNTPKELLDITAQVIDAAATKVNVSQEEKETLIGYVKEYKMGELFSHLKGYDIQAVRAKAKEEAMEEAKKEVRKEVQKEVQNAKKEIIEETKKEVGIQTLIESYQELNVSKEDTLKRIIQKFSLEQPEAEKYIAMYWNET